MKTFIIISFLVGFCVGLVINVKVEYTPTTIELSVGGKVKVLKFSPTDTIHVIADDDLKLTDIKAIPIVFTPLYESPNQVSEVSRRESKESRGW